MHIDDDDFENVSDGDHTENRRILSSQFYHDAKSAIKKIAYFFLVVLIGYAAFRIFSFWIFAGFFISAVPMAWLIVHITKTPTTLVLAMHISENDEDSDYFSMYGIPDAMLDRFSRSGGDFYYLTASDGVKVAVCDSIDFENFTIQTPWFDELSNMEFFRNKQAFVTLKEMLVAELRENGDMRSLQSALVYKGVNNELKKHYEKFDKVMLEPESDIEQKSPMEVLQDGINTPDGIPAT